LFNNTTGIFNTGAGFRALVTNSSGSHNTAIGVGALNHNMTGGFNTAIGFLSGSLTTASLTFSSGISAWPVKTE
jgi:hypothetical protein